MASRLRDMRRLEGSKVCLALTGGRRIDDCDLISARTDRSGCLWIFSNGADQFVAHREIIDCWEAPL